MSVSINQKVDLLYKQAFGVTKTDNETNKSPSNETIASPLLIRGDTVWMQSDQIPAIAANVTNIVQGYTGASAVKCVADTTTVPVGGIYPTWKTNLTDWIPAQFGSTYNVSVYIDNSNATDPTSTGTQIFAAGSGGTGEYYFNYVSGVLNFIGETIPAALTSGKVLYVVGYRYIGAKGIQNNPGNINLGNLNIVNNVISSIIQDANVQISPNGTGILYVTSSIEATGNITGYDITANGNINVLGNATFANLDLGNLTGSGNLSAANLSTSGSLTVSETANVGNLTTSGNISATGNISGGNISTTGDVSATGNISGNNLNISNVANILGNLDVGGNLNLTGNGDLGNLGVAGFVYTNLIPSTNNTYVLGNSTYAWQDLYLANSLNIGTAQLTATGTVVTTADANITNNLVANTATFNGNVIFDNSITVAGNLTVTGTTTYINVTDLNVTDPIIELGGGPNGAEAPVYDDKDRGLFLHNYFSNNYGPINQFAGWKTSRNQFEFASNATVSSSTVTVNEYGNIKANVIIANLSGTVLSSSQPNITSLGTLTGLVVNGNANISQTANISTLIASNLTYPTSDGTAGQAIHTYGNGTLYFQTVHTNQIYDGNSNVFVYPNANVTISSNGVANVLDVYSTGATITGNVDVTANLTTNNITANNNVDIGTTGISWANLTTTSTAANQVIVSLDSNNIRGVEFFVRGVESVGAKYSVATLQAVHDGTDVDFSNYGTVTKGGSPGSLSVIWDSGNIKLVVQPASSNNTVWTTQFRTI